MVIKPSHTLFHDLKSSEHMEPHLVAVPNTDVKAFYKSYATLSDDIVPESLTLIDKDNDTSLFALVVVKASRDEASPFPAACRARKWTPRAYRDDEGTSDDVTDKLSGLRRESDEQWEKCVEFARDTFKKALDMWFHIVVLNSYIETILRYGLPVSSVSCFIDVSKYNIPSSIIPCDVACVVQLLTLFYYDRQCQNVSPSTVKSKLDTKFGYLGGQGVKRDKKGRIVEEEPDMAVPGMPSDQSYAPYVFYQMEIPASEVVE